MITVRGIHSLFIGVAIILLTGITGCASVQAGASPESAGSGDFNLIFKYGFGGRNTLDTFKGIYTKDMGADAPITVSISLTREEKDKIYQKIMEIDFFNYPDKFSVVLPDGEIENRVMPYDTYFFKVTCDGRTKELLWHEKATNSEAQSDKLRELIKLIRGIIESKEEYRQLPEASSGYS